MNNTATATDAVPRFRCSVIIPTRDKLEYLQPCVESVLASTNADSIELIVIDNCSEEPATLQFLDSLSQRSNCQVLKWQQPFNYSAINNFAARHANSDVLCLLNNDIEVTDPDWLEKLVPLAQRKDVGAVGCLLLYPDRKIQHAGIALDSVSVAKHIALAEPEDYLARCNITQPYVVDAATAACLLVRRASYLQLGGLNETHLSVAYNDVDFCLRLAEKGLPTLLHPGVALLHHESVSRQSDAIPANRARAAKEYAYMLGRWHYRLVGQGYSDGMPAKLIRAQDNSPESLEAMISEAIQRLYQLPPDEVDLAFNTGQPALSSGHSDAQFWREHYQELEDRYEAMEAHAQRLEELHSRILNSPLRKLTAPLRWLRARLRGQSQEPTNSVQALNAEQDRQRATAAGNNAKLDHDSDDYKIAYRDSAQTHLQQFLAGEETLLFPTKQKPVLSIVLVLYNQAALSLLCLKSLLAHADIPLQLIIIDNASSDETQALLDRIEGAVIVRNDDNAGFVHAVNQGAKLAEAEFLLLLNNDAMVESGSLPSAVATMRSDKAIGAVGARIKLLNGKLQEAGSIIWSDGACLGYGRNQDPEAPEYLFQRDVDYCSGAFLLFRRQLFLDMGGFDEAYAPAYYEESDYCIRLWEQGYRVVYDPNAVIVHYEFASSNGFAGAAELQSKHRKLLCAKHEDYLSKRPENSPDNILQGRHGNQQKKILLIDDRVPHPSLGAGYPRCADMLHALSDMGLNLTLFPMLYPTDDWEEVYKTLPRSVEVMLNIGEIGLESFLRARMNYYDAIVISREHNMKAFRQITDRRPELIAGAEIIYDAEAGIAPRGVLRWRELGQALSPTEERMEIAEELALADTANSIVAVSQREAAIFQDNGHDHTYVLGHCMTAQPGPRKFAERQGLLFVGALRDDGSPNVDSLLWFVINVLPLIEETLPDVKLTVVGDNTAASLATIQKSNIEFTGRLDSLTEQYDRCRVFLAPTRFAAGIPHKIHEAASHGIPCVATPLLAEQLGWQHEQELLVAEDAADFAQQCLRLLQDETLWQSVRDQGLKGIEKDCSAQRFHEALKEIFL